MNTAQESTASLVASYLEAIGTIAAVLVALFLQVVLVKMRRAELKISATLNPTDGSITAIKTHAGHVDCYLSIKVSARAKREAARNVRAFLVKVVRPPDASNGGIVPSASFSWPNTGPAEAEAITIPAGTWRRLSLLRYRGQVSNSDQQPTLIPVLSLPLRTPLHRRYLLDDPGVYRLIIEISADGIDPSFWQFQFLHAPVEVLDEEDLLTARVREVEVRMLSRAEIVSLLN